MKKFSFYMMTDNKDYLTVTLQFTEISSCVMYYSAESSNPGVDCTLSTGQVIHTNISCFYRYYSGYCSSIAQRIEQPAYFRTATGEELSYSSYTKGLLSVYGFAYSGVFTNSYAYWILK